MRDTSLIAATRKTERSINRSKHKFDKMNDIVTDFHTQVGEVLAMQRSMVQMQRKMARIGVHVYSVRKIQQAFRRWMAMNRLFLLKVARFIRDRVRFRMFYKRRVRAVCMLAKRIRMCLAQRTFKALKQRKTAACRIQKLYHKWRMYKIIHYRFTILGKVGVLLKHFYLFGKCRAVMHMRRVEVLRVQREEQAIYAQLFAEEQRKAQEVAERIELEGRKIQEEKIANTRMRIAAAMKKQQEAAAAGAGVVNNTIKISNNGSRDKKRNSNNSNSGIKGKSSIDGQANKISDINNKFKQEKTDKSNTSKNKNKIKHEVVPEEQSTHPAISNNNNSNNNSATVPGGDGNFENATLESQSSHTYISVANRPVDSTAVLKAYSTGVIAGQASVKAMHTYIENKYGSVYGGFYGEYCCIQDNRVHSFAAVRFRFMLRCLRKKRLQALAGPHAKLFFYMLSHHGNTSVQRNKNLVVQWLQNAVRSAAVQRAVRLTIKNHNNNNNNNNNNSNNNNIGSVNSVSVGAGAGAGGRFGLGKLLMNSLRRSRIGGGGIPSPSTLSPTDLNECNMPTYTVHTSSSLNYPPPSKASLSSSVKVSVVRNGDRGAVNSDNEDGEEEDCDEDEVEGSKDNGIFLTSLLSSQRQARATITPATATIAIQSSSRNPPSRGLTSSFPTFSPLQFPPSFITDSYRPRTFAELILILCDMRRAVLRTPSLVDDNQPPTSRSTKTFGGSAKVVSAGVGVGGSAKVVSAGVGGSTKVVSAGGCSALLRGPSHASNSSNSNSSYKLNVESTTSETVASTEAIATTRTGSATDISVVPQASTRENGRDRKIIQHATKMVSSKVPQKDEVVATIITSPGDTIKSNNKKGASATNIGCDGAAAAVSFSNSGALLQQSSMAQVAQSISTPPVSQTISPLDETNTTSSFSDQNKQITVGAGTIGIINDGTGVYTGSQDRTDKSRIIPSQLRAPSRTLRPADKGWMSSTTTAGSHCGGYKPVSPTAPSVAAAATTASSIATSAPTATVTTTSSATLSPATAVSVNVSSISGVVRRGSYGGRQALIKTPTPQPVPYHILTAPNDHKPTGNKHDNIKSEDYFTDEIGTDGTTEPSVAVSIDALTRADRDDTDTSQTYCSSPIHCIPVSAIIAAARESVRHSSQSQV